MGDAEPPLIGRFTCWERWWDGCTEVKNLVTDDNIDEVELYLLLYLLLLLDRTLEESRHDLNCIGLTSVDIVGPIFHFMVELPRLFLDVSNSVQGYVPDDIDPILEYGLLEVDSFNSLLFGG